MTDPDVVTLLPDRELSADERSVLRLIERLAHVRVVEISSADDPPEGVVVLAPFGRLVMPGDPAARRERQLDLARDEVHS